MTMRKVLLAFLLAMRVHRSGSLLLALASLLGVNSPAAATTISGAILFSSDSTGAPSGGQIWNIAGGDFIFNLYLSTTSDASSGFLNSGDGLSTSISSTLALGTTTLFMFGAPGSDPSGVAALNLFFNGNNFSPSSPGIAAVNQTNSAGTGLGAASATTTYDLAPPGFATNVTSPQTLTFVDGSTTVMLTSLVWTTNLASVDLVTAFNNTPDGAMDFFGSFTLEVSAVSEPATLLLFGTMAAGLGLVRSRARRHQEVAAQTAGSD